MLKPCQASRRRNSADGLPLLLTWLGPRIDEGVVVCWLPMAFGEFMVFASNKMSGLKEVRLHWTLPSKNDPFVRYQVNPWDFDSNFSFISLVNKGIL